VYCFDAITGEELWSYPTGHLIVSSPAVFEGKVYVGSTDNYVYCLDAYNGECIWSYQTGWGIAQSSPAVFHGKVFIGSQDYKLYCLNASTGSKIWDHMTGYWISSSPAVTKDKVYVGSNDGFLYCLNMSNGETIWQYAVSGDPIWTSSPTIANENVYVGALNCKVYCISASNGSELWTYPTGNWVTGTAAVANGKVYIGSWDSNMYCLDATTGTLVWTYQTGGGIDSSPAIADGKVYFGSSDHWMYCLDAETGEEIWKYLSGGQINSSPAIAEGNVYVGSMDYNVYCFGSGNQLPVADFTWTPQSPYTAESVVFNASTSFDPDGYITLYEWDWNHDGVYEESHTTPSATHSWASPGNYTVTLQVTDDAGLKGTQSKIIAVEDFNVTITGTMGDNGWYVSNIIITINGFYHNHTYYKLHTADPWTEYTGSPITISADGVFELWIAFVDSEGQWHVYGPYTFKIDKTAPTISLTVMSLNCWKTKWLLNATVSDAASGIANVEFYIDDILVGNATSPPYTFTYSGKGKMAQAIAYDYAGNSNMQNMESLPTMRTLRALIAHVLQFIQRMMEQRWQLIR